MTARTITARALTAAGAAMLLGAPAHAADALAGLYLAGPASADDTTPDARSLGSAKIDKTLTVRAVAQVSAASGNGAASLKLVRAWHDDKVSSAPLSGGPHNGLYEWKSFTSTVSLVLSAPLNKGDGPTDILNFGGLPSDFKAKIGYSIFWGTTYADFTRYNALVETAVTLCESKFPKPADKLKNCDNPIAEDVVKKYLPNADASAAVLGKDTDAQTIGFEATIGYLKADYFDPATAAKNHMTNTPWSAKIYAGAFPSELPLFVVGALEYQRSYDEKPTGTLCPTVPPAPVLTCVTGHVGAPVKTEKLIGSLELRRQFDISSISGIVGMDAVALDLKASYDFKSDEYGFDLPITFAIDDKQNLIGGVRLGWHSDKHDIVAGLFVGSAFSLFGG